AQCGAVGRIVVNTYHDGLLWIEIFVPPPTAAGRIRIDAARTSDPSHPGLQPIQRIDPPRQLRQRVGIEILTAHVGDVAKDDGQFLLRELVLRFRDVLGVRILAAGDDEEGKALVRNAVRDRAGENRARRGYTVNDIASLEA